MVYTIICWVLDKYRTSIEPATIAFLSNVDAREVKMRQRHIADFKANRAAAVELTKLKNYRSNKEWHNWRPCFENFLSAILGINGVLLTYVMRNNNIPLKAMNLHSGNVDYTTILTFCASLQGPHYVVDNQRVHQNLTNLIEGNAQAIKKLRELQSFCSGQRDYAEINCHFSGFGTGATNQPLRIKSITEKEKED